MAASQRDPSPPRQQRHPNRYPSPSPSPSIDLLCAVALSLVRALDDRDGSDRDRRLGLRDLNLTPARVASMLLGASLTMMLCGSATFLIGFVLMPWVLGLVAALYVAGVVTGLSRAAKAVVAAALGCRDRDGCCCGCDDEDLSPGQLLTKFPII